MAHAMLIKSCHRNCRAITRLHVRGAVPRVLYQFVGDAALYYRRRPLQARQRDLVFRIQQPQPACGSS